MPLPVKDWFAVPASRSLLLPAPVVIVPGTLEAARAPLMMGVPVTVRIVSSAILSWQFGLTLKLKHVANTSQKTGEEFVAGMTTTSPATGTTPPTQVAGSLQLPPVVWLVMVAAGTRLLANSMSADRMARELLRRMRPQVFTVFITGIPFGNMEIGLSS